MGSNMPFFDVTEYGAAGDGRTLNTSAIQECINACHKAGGGTVFFPTGRFVSGTFSLKDRVFLHLSPGAVLAGSRDAGDYSRRHLIYTEYAGQLGITGYGVIDGQDDAFLKEKFKVDDWRPCPLISFVKCKQLLVESVIIRSAPAWTLHTKNCEDVKIRGVSILNKLNAPNSDGIDIDSSRNVVISDCNIESGDDCIVLKTTRRPHPDADIPGGDEGAPNPTENVTVTNCAMVSSCSALKLGSESHGDFRNCVFSNCVIRDSRTGIAVLAKDGGNMEGIHFSNIVITTAPKLGRGIEWPIAIDSEKRTDNTGLSKIRDVSLSNITVYTRGRIIAQGQPGAVIDGLSFRDITMRIQGFEDVQSSRKLSIGPSSKINRIDLGSKPAALIFAYIKGLKLENVNLIWPDLPDPPPRHALYGEALIDADYSGVRGGATDRNIPAIKIKNLGEAPDDLSTSGNTAASI